MPKKSVNLWPKKPPLPVCSFEFVMWRRLVLSTCRLDNLERKPFEASILPITAPWGREMLSRAGMAVCLLLMSISVPLAQTNTPEVQDQTESMEPPLPGDHWTYEIHDDITGSLKFTTTNVVTDVTANEISVRMENLGNPGTGYYVYDHAWNVKTNPTWKFSPNDGTGIALPLKAGSNWKIQSNDLYAARGISWKRSGSSKTVGEESITIRAGTFNTFKIETSISIRNANDPTKKSDLIMTTWYAPSINHWVKRASKTISEGHVNEQITAELVEYGRR